MRFPYPLLLFQMGAGAPEELVEELVDIQQVAARDGKVLAWIGATTPQVQNDPCTQREPPPLSATH